jgi:hypothetical protein
VIKGQPLALMRPPATGEGRQLLVRNRTSQDFYDARFLLMDNFRFGSFSEVGARNREVRFIRLNGHRQTARSGPESAESSRFDRRLAPLQLTPT